MGIMNRPSAWTGTLCTNTGAFAWLVSGPDKFGNFTVEGDFGRGVERRYFSDDGVDVTSLSRFVRPIDEQRESRAIHRRDGRSPSTVPATVKRRPAQTNIRSDIVKRRVAEVTARTGMTATQFLEEAVLRYDPPVEVVPAGLKRVGRLLVVDLPPGVSVTLDDINAAIAADRNGERD